MIFSLPTRCVLKALASTTGRRASPRLSSLPPSPSLLLASRSVSQTSSTPSSAENDISDSIPPPSPAPSPPSKIPFEPNFFSSLVSSSSALATALQIARGVDFAPPVSPEGRKQRTLVQILLKATAFTDENARTTYLKYIDLQFASPEETVARQREKARKDVKGGGYAKIDALSLEEWDEKSRKGIEKKMGTMEEGGDKEKTRKKLEKRQALLRRESVLRRDVKTEMEKEEKEKEEEGKERGGESKP
ncbi:hypothetical protein BDY24DRAFT_416546 [Mrakia frigida]|uniref:uncharacterized protein n=1 Tax=Mrakia frigida TaxID=29902 RepID=UPI003FCC176E